MYMYIYVYMDLYLSPSLRKKNTLKTALSVSLSFRRDIFPLSNLLTKKNNLQFGRSFTKRSTPHSANQ